MMVIPGHATTIGRNTTHVVNVERRVIIWVMTNVAKKKKTQENNMYKMEMMERTKNKLVKVVETFTSLRGRSPLNPTNQCVSH